MQIISATISNLIAIVAVLAGTSSIVASDIFQVGERQVCVPPPEGFVPFRERGAGWSRYFAIAADADQFNRTAAIFVRPALTEEVERGLFPTLDEWCVFKVNRRMEFARISKVDFAQFASQSASTLKETAATTKALVDSGMETLSKTLSEEIGQDASTSVPEVVQLEPHIVSDRIFGFSQYTRFKFHITQSQPRIKVSSGTSLILHVKGTMLQFSVYAPANKMLWTRKAADHWATSIFKANQ